jgi:uncharacterized protein YcfL
MKTSLKAAAIAVAAFLSLAGVATAADEAPATGAAAKLMLRGGDLGVKVVEMRVVRKSDILTIQADFENTKKRDRVVYYRFRWLDADGNQVGDGDAFKQVTIMGKQLTTLKGIAPRSSVIDFRIEMNATTGK